jgi:ABC-type methionine transport system ATPase subunit
VLNTFKGRIEFRNVSFRYPSRDVLVLRNVSFVVEPGQMAALVGHSGSGKSTCVQLLERFYDVTEGVILLDGQDIRELDPRWLHHVMALVAQEPILFQMTIRENVKYGKRKATDQEVESAIEIANARKFISKLDKGLDTVVGEKGSTLSGGQRQRIAIARAVIRDPVILVTDEATSALDAASEKRVQLALDKVMEGRTAVVVAHRLSTIRNAQVIYVFDTGEIKEQGTHDELVAKREWYYELVKRQLTEGDMKLAGVEDRNVDELIAPPDYDGRIRKDVDRRRLRVKGKLRVMEEDLSDSDLEESDGFVKSGQKVSGVADLSDSSSSSSQEIPNPVQKKKKSLTSSNVVTSQGKDSSAQGKDSSAQGKKESLTSASVALSHEKGGSARGKKVSLTSSEPVQKKKESLPSPSTSTVPEKPSSTQKKKGNLPSSSDSRTATSPEKTNPAQKKKHSLPSSSTSISPEIVTPGQKKKSVWSSSSDSSTSISPEILNRGQQKPLNLANFSDSSTSGWEERPNPARRKPLNFADLSDLSDSSISTEEKEEKRPNLTQKKTQRFGDSSDELTEESSTTKTESIKDSDSESATWEPQ